MKVVQHSARTFRSGVARAENAAGHERIPPGEEPDNSNQQREAALKEIQIFIEMLERNKEK
jgi:hypothetical protein